MHRSIATMDKPEFINLQPLDVNPLMSKCEIKVFYLGGNRNHSYITKEVATEMAKNLRGAPIVGYYKEDKEDFADHGEQVIFDDEGIHFNCLTKPYGFVAPDAEVWFQKFIDTDDFGNEIEREYLMTTGYLWTGQFEEVQSVVEGEGKPHSMELDNETLDGHWSTNNQDGIEYFIIDDAVISKLCILGEDVEPCFEGSTVTKPQVSASFSKESEEDTFLRTLFTMMQDLKSALNKEGGQSKMELEDKELENNEIQEPEVEETEGTEEEVVEQPVDDNTPEAEPEEANEEEPIEGEEEVAPEGEEENADAASDGEVENSEEEVAPSEEFSKEDDDEENKEDEVEVDNTLAEEHEALKAEFTALKAEYDALVEFKNKIDNEKKDELIKSFYMLSDEDKKDVIENKEKYTFDEIKSKLAIICFDKKVNFDLDDSSKNEEIVENNSDANVTTFSLDNDNNSIPAWIKAVINNRNK